VTDRVVTFTAAEKAELVDLPPDEKPLEPTEVAGRTRVSLISPGTEIGGSYLGTKFPAQPGYAAVFEVEDLGADVKDLKAGDLVFCTGPMGVGGHRSRQRCKREAALPVPPGLSPEVAVHARLMNVTMSTLTTTAARPPDKVLVTGLGPVGHLGAQIFQACGYQVMAVDPVESRRRLALKKGIRDVRAAVPLEDRAAVADTALVLECSAHEQAILDACKAVRKRGEVVLVGVPRQRRTELYAFDIVQTVFQRYVVLRSGWEWEVSRYAADFRVGSVFGNLAGALRWLAEGRVNVDGLYAMADPKDCQRVYQDLMHQRLEALSVVFDWA
jgi:threonine dehydrogenase-like Zn-dependent dehydrogenase